MPLDGVGSREGEGREACKRNLLTGVVRIRFYCVHLMLFDYASHNEFSPQARANWTGNRTVGISSMSRRSWPRAERNPAIQMNYRVVPVCKAAGEISLTHSLSTAGLHHWMSCNGSSGLVSRNSSTGLRLGSVRTNGFGPRARIRNWRVDTS